MTTKPQPPPPARDHTRKGKFKRGNRAALRASANMSSVLKVCLTTQDFARCDEAACLRFMDSKLARRFWLSEWARATLAEAASRDARARRLPLL